MVNPISKLAGAAVFQRYIRAGGNATDFGFTGRLGDVSRFMARYRLAISYQGVRLHGYSKDTSAAYSSLLHLFLAWSAFEQYGVITGLSKKGTLHHEDVDRIFWDAGIGSELTDLLDSKPVREFFAFVATTLDSKKLVESLAKYVAGGPVQPRVLLTALRHSFAHGPLTANAGPRAPRKVAAAATALATWVLNFMQCDFAGRIDARHSVGANV